MARRARCLGSALAFDAVAHWARRAWIERESATPAVRWTVFALASMLVVAIDVAAHAAHWTAYLFVPLVALLAAQLAWDQQRWQRRASAHRSAP